MVEQAPAQVSVIIPVYNGTNYLRSAIDSVLAQTYPFIELIVVDDGSTDETWALILSYGPRLNSYRKENGGVASALNYGIKRAHGDYVAWLSHDDVFAPEKIEKQINFLQEKSEFAACYTDYLIIDDQGMLILRYQAAWGLDAHLVRALFRQMFINGSTVLIRRSCFETVGLFNEQLPRTQDVEMWFRLADRFAIGYLPGFLVTRRDHPAQLSWDVRDQIKEEQNTYLSIFQELGPERLFPEWVNEASIKNLTSRLLAAAYTWLGDEMYKHRGWYRFGADCFQRSIQIDPIWNNPARFKRVWMEILVLLLGDEHQAATVIRQGRLMLRQGEASKARAFFWQVLSYRPWRLDVFALLTLTLIGPAPVQAILRAKRALGRLRSTAL